MQECADGQIPVHPRNTREPEATSGPPRGAYAEALACLSVIAVETTPALLFTRWHGVEIE